jgi:hypothetical protein
MTCISCITCRRRPVLIPAGVTQNTERRLIVSQWETVALEKQEAKVVACVRMHRQKSKSSITMIRMQLCIIKRGIVSSTFSLRKLLTNRHRLIWQDHLRYMYWAKL